MSMPIEAGAMMGERFIAVIPARLKSTRLPDKPLADIAGKPMVVRVAERAAASGATEVWVATDHASIVEACQQHGLGALMTRPDHLQGTDRIAEVVQQLGLDDAAIVVNVQGDEPLIAPLLIQAVAARLSQHADAAIATAAHPIRDAADFLNPNVVKVVCDAQGYAHYFSRAPIPYARDHFAETKTSLPDGFPAWRHIGIYGYRAGFLKRYAALSPAPAEQFEALEQLRALYHGYRIVVHEWLGEVLPGVDTPADLARVQAWYDAHVHVNLIKGR